MKKFLLAIGLVFALTACGGGTTEPEPDVEAPADEPTDETADEEAASGDFDVTAAEETYQKSCIGCHGQNLEGVSGPALENNDLSASEILTILENGRGSMPAMNLPEDEADNIAKWLETQ